MKKHNIFIIHGVGTQADGYADDLIAKIRKHGADTKHLNFVEIVYSDIMDEKVKSFTLNEVAIKDLILKDWRETFNLNVFDGIAYGYKRPKIMKRLESEILPLAENCDNSFIAHSLGGLVLYDFLVKNNFQAKNIFTLGTPLALRLIGNQAKIRVDFWLNIIGTSDIIAKPLKTDFLNVKECDYDYVAPVGSFLQRKTPLSHVGYWTDDNVINPIVKKLALDITGKFDKNAYIKWIEKLWKI